MIKLASTKEINAFCTLCEQHIYNDKKNAFLNRKISTSSERHIQSLMAKAGFHEFSEAPSLWPSLFLSTDEYKENLYYKHIPLCSSDHHHIEATTMTFESHRLFNLSSVIDDPHRSLNDSMILRALDKPLTTRVLLKNNEVWMMNVPSESKTIDPIAAKVKGRVLTLGLGIGYFIYMAMHNPRVTSIDVVELDLNVIDYFDTYIRPHFPQTIPITVHHGDAKTWIKQHSHQYDHVFIDTYQNENDGCEWWLLGCESISLPYDCVHYWIESSLSQRMRIAMFAYLRRHNKNNYDHLTQVCIEKVSMYYRTHDCVLNNVNEVKSWLYNHDLYRTIASTPRLNQAQSE